MAVESYARRPGGAQNGGRKDLTDRFRKKLDALGITYTQHPVVGSTSPDFLLSSPSGSSALVEAKFWPPSASSLGRASELVHIYQISSGVRNSFVLLPDLPKGPTPPNVISPNRLEPLVEALSKKPSPRASRPRVRKQPAPTATVFVAMPFSRRFDKPFELALKPACASRGLTCVRIDKQHYAGDIVARIKTSIRTARLLIADVTTSNPNVLFEIGYAQAIGRPVIQISASSLKRLPFDIRNDNTIRYRPSALAALRKELEKTIRNTCRR